MSARDRITQTIERWFLVEPLLFSVWTTHHLVIEPRIKTIRVREGRVEYNPTFIDALDRRELEAVLRCEATRILLKHPYTRRKENAKLAYEASNITLQEYLHTGLPMPTAYQVFGTDEFNQQYFEFYYYKLQELVDKTAVGGGEPGKGQESESQGASDQALNSAGGQADGDESAGGGTAEQPDQPEPSDSESDTGTDADTDTETAEKSPVEQYTDSSKENTEDWDIDELLNDRINDQIRNAQESDSWGTVAGKFRERILAALKPKLDYRLILRQFRATILSTNRVLTRMKPSRRYGFLYMGSRRDFATRLLFAVDVSGSISNKDLARGFSVINQFFKYGIQTIDVVQFDTEIKGKLLSLKRARHEVVAFGRGGTAFEPIMAYIDEHRDYDGLIIFTDGYAPIPPKPKNRKTRVLWLFNNESSYQAMYQGLRPIGRAAFLKED